jgi:hypothetical protein
MESAPLHIPIEIRPTGGTAPRVFRTARALTPLRITLTDGLPEEPAWLHGSVILRFYVPGNAEVIECHGRARELVLDEGTPQERGALAAFDLDGVPPDAAQRIEQYVIQRLEQA